MIVEIVIFLLTFLVAYYLYTHWKVCGNFEKHGVKVKPCPPVFGNLLKSTFLKHHIIDDFNEVYNAFPDERYVGFLDGTTPAILLRDPELIKNVTVKDFDHFVNHKEFFSEELDPLFGGSLFGMKGDRWRDMRTTLSPAFTGSKMRLMMPFMVEISNNVVQYLKDHQSEDIDVDDVIHRYANDVIASAAFGLQENSLENKNSKFYEMGQTVFNFTFWQRVGMFFVAQFPSLAKKANLGIFPQTTQNFFRNLVHTTMKYREENNIDRPDMIQLLMQASKGTLQANHNEKDEGVGFATVDEVLKDHKTAREWTQDELAAQVFLFFIAGFETSATAAIMTIHELAINPHIQDKLYEEIKEFNETRGDITYDSMGELKYLDCTINETFRKWAAAIALDRICLKTYELPPAHPGAKPYTLQPGDLVYNSVNGIHLDPAYYPEPEVFKPERFSEENRHNIKPYTFMPFGSGPRNCIGSRFALMELKALLFYLVLNFKIQKCDKTMDPIQLLKRDFNIKARDGTWVRFETRKN